MGKKVALITLLKSEITVWGLLKAPIRHVEPVAPESH